MSATRSGVRFVQLVAQSLRLAILLHRNIRSLDNEKIQDADLAFEPNRKERS